MVIKVSKHNPINSRILVEAMKNSDSPYHLFFGQSLWADPSLKLRLKLT